jgi:predicted ABC-type ATPase
VFSHPSKLALIEEAQRCGYTVALYIVALDDPARLLTRVAQRVREGGHPVPPERILARYPRTMDNLAQAVRQADVSYLYDAAEATGTSTGPQLVAVCSPAQVTPLAQPLPAWAQRLTSQ